MGEITLQLNSPITDEQWDTIMDIDFDHADRITFHTKHGKEVEFVKSKPIKTNADKYFRNATDEELAKWLRGFAEKIAKQCCEVYTMDADFEKDTLDWLKQEVSE